MPTLDIDSPFILSDDNKKYVGLRNPDGTDQSLSGGGASLTEVAVSSANSATTNTSLLQAALNNSGTIRVVGSGEILINSPLVIKSNTHLSLSANTTIKLAANADCNLLVNENWQSPMFNISTLTLANFAISQGRTSKFTFSTPLPHNYAVGDYVLIKGDTTDTMTGVHVVREVINSTRLVIYINTWVNDGTQGGVTTIPTPAGTITCQKADGNILIEGGYWDYNITNQPVAADSYKHMGINLCKVGYLTVRDVRVSAAAYSIWIQNVYGAKFLNVRCDSTRDGIHISGPCRRILIDGIHGMTYDDIIAYTGDGRAVGGSDPLFQLNYNVGASTVSYLPTSDANGGELIGLTIRNVMMQHQQLRMLIAPKGGLECSGILIDGYTNQQIGGTAAMLLISNEDNSTNNVIEDITIRNVRLANNVGTNSNNVPIIVSGSTGKIRIKKLLIDNVTMGKGAAMKANSTLVSVENGASFDSITIRDCALNYQIGAGEASIIRMIATTADPSGNVLIENIKIAGTAGDTGGLYFAAHLAGVNVNSITLRGCEFGLVAIALSTYTAANLKTPITLESCILNGAKAFYTGSAVMSMKLINCKVISATQGILNLFGSTPNTYNIWIQNLQYGGGYTDAIINNMTVDSCNLKLADSTVRVDVTKLNRVGSAGVMCIHNGGTAAGTIVNNNLVVCDTTGVAGSWKQVSNPALSF